MDLYAQSAAMLNEKRLTASLLEQTRVLTLLYDIGKELTSILDRDSLLRKVGERAKQLINYDLFSVMVINPQTQRLESALSLKYDEGIHGHRTLALGEGICGTAAMERRPIRVSEVSKDPRYIRCDLDAGVQSELVVPLIAQDRVLGVLDLESLSPGAFTEDHEQMLATLASIVAIALENGEAGSLTGGQGSTNATASPGEHTWLSFAKRLADEATGENPGFPQVILDQFRMAIVVFGDQNGDFSALSWLHHGYSPFRWRIGGRAWFPCCGQAGKDTIKVLPLPMVDSTRMLPLLRSIIRRTIVSPSPSP